MALFRAFHIPIVLLVVADYSNNPILGYAQALKESGTKVIIAPKSGFQDLDLNEEYIATGKADMISMARTWWAGPEYGKKAYAWPSPRHPRSDGILRKALTFSSGRF